MLDAFPPADRRLSILVVDDEPAIRFALSRFYTRRGWDVADAPSGEAALALLRGVDADFDVVLCDVNMPGLSGPELFRQLAVEAPHWIERFVLASGDVTAPAVVALETLAGCAVLAKPFELAELLALTTGLATRALA